MTPRSAFLHYPHSEHPPLDVDPFPSHEHQSTHSSGQSTHFCHATSAHLIFLFFEAVLACIFPAIFLFARIPLIRCQKMKASYLAVFNSISLYVDALPLRCLVSHDRIDCVSGNTRPVLCFLVRCGGSRGGCREEGRGHPLSHFWRGVGLPGSLCVHD